MPCKQFQATLTDGAASGAPSPELRQHLTTCSSCQAAFLAEQNLFASIDSTLHAQVNAEIPSAFVSRAQARLAQTRLAEGRLAEARLAENKLVAQTPNWIPSWAFAAVSAAIILLAIVFPMIKSRQPHSDSPLAQLSSGAATNKTIQNPPVKPSETPGVSIATHRSHSAHSHNNSSRASTHSSDPEVIVPPTERQAFAQFVAAAHKQNPGRGQRFINR